MRLHHVCAWWCLWMNDGGGRPPGVPIWIQGVPRQRQALLSPHIFGPGTQGYQAKVSRPGGPHSLPPAVKEGDSRSSLSRASRPGLWPLSRDSTGYGWQESRV